MIEKVKFGENVADLLELLNMKPEEEKNLWDYGFDLDDMDWWMAIPRHYNEEKRMYWNEVEKHIYYKMDDYDHINPIEYEETEFKYDWDTCPFWLIKQFDMMDKHCVGFRWTAFGDYDIFTVHHA